MLILLEALFSAFDEIATRHGIYKVETVGKSLAKYLDLIRTNTSTGDCYVAAAGIPDPKDNHASMAVSFAKDVITKVELLANQLVVQLGPDTGKYFCLCLLSALELPSLYSAISLLSAFVLDV